MTKTHHNQINKYFFKKSPSGATAGDSRETQSLGSNTSFWRLHCLSFLGEKYFPAQRERERMLRREAALAWALVVVKLSRTPCGSWARQPSHVPGSLFVGNGLHTPRVSLSPTEKIPEAGGQGRAWTQRQGKISQGRAVQLRGGSGLPQGIHTTGALSSLWNRNPQQAEDVSDLYSGGDWYSCSVTKSSPPLCNL